MSNIGIALEISALGMSLVFAALILLWGMMNLLTAFTADQETLSPETPNASTPIERDAAIEDLLRAQAVAVAVAMALAEQPTSSAHPLAFQSTANVSAWQLGMRSRQMYQKGSSRRRGARQENR